MSYDCQKYVVVHRIQHANWHADAVENNGILGMLIGISLYLVASSLSLRNERFTIVSVSSIAMICMPPVHCSVYNGALIAAWGDALAACEPILIVSNGQVQSYNIAASNDSDATPVVF